MNLAWLLCRDETCLSSPAYLQPFKYSTRVLCPAVHSLFISSVIAPMRCNLSYVPVSHWCRGILAANNTGRMDGGRNEVLLSTVFICVSSRLQAEQTSQKRSWRLQLLLPKRGPKAFSSFCSALRATDQQHLCDLLTQTSETNGNGTHVEASVSHA